MNGNYGNSDGSSNSLQLTPEQLNHLFNKMSSDEQNELQETLKKCTTEVTMTRGLPFSALVVGSLYFARTRLPAQYHFGPKGWPFYAIMGIGSLTVANMFGMGMCKERVNPRIQQLWNKYQLNDARTSYQDLRAKNRQQYGEVAQQQQLPIAYSGLTQESHDDTQNQGGRHSSSHVYDPMNSPAPVRSSPASSRFAYDEPVMSGTPSGMQGSMPGSPKGKTNQYGDVDFS